jgi:preprotein translocase subunit YajC
MDLSLLLITAQAPQNTGGGFQAFIPIILLVLIFYFMLIRPQQRREKERKKMIEEAKKGDRVMFSGGIIGSIANIKDTTFVIKVADNVKLEAAKASVSKVLEKGEKPAASEKE